MLRSRRPSTETAPTSTKLASTCPHRKRSLPERLVWPVSSSTSPPVRARRPPYPAVDASSSTPLQISSHREYLTRAHQSRFWRFSLPGRMIPPRCYTESGWTVVVWAATTGGRQSWTRHPIRSMGASIQSGNRISPKQGWRVCEGYERCRGIRAPGRASRTKYTNATTNRHTPRNNVANSRSAQESSARGVN